MTKNDINLPKELTLEDKLRAFIGTRFITSEYKVGEFTIFGEAGSVTWKYSDELRPVLMELYPKGIIDIGSFYFDQIEYSHTTRI